MFNTTSDGLARRSDNSQWSVMPGPNLASLDRIGSDRSFTAANDIESMRNAEEMLRNSEQDFRTMIDGLGQSVVVLSPDGGTLYANRVALDLTGLSQPGATGKTGFFQSVYHPDDLKGLREELPRGSSAASPSILSCGRLPARDNIAGSSFNTSH